MAIDLVTAEPEGLFGFVALVVVLGVWLLFVLGIRWLRWRGLDSQQRRTVARLRQHLANWSPSTVTITESDDQEMWREELLDRAHGAADGQAGVRTALGNVAGAVAARTQPFPRLSVYLASEAMALAVSAALVLVSAPAIRRFLQKGDVGPVEAVGEAWEIAATVGATLWDAFPGTNLLWALVTIFVLRIYTWLSTHAFEVAVGLALLAVAVAGLDRVARVEGDRRLYPNRRQLLARVGAWVGGIYLAGAVPATIAEELGSGGLGAALGGILAFLVLVGGVIMAAIDVARRLRSTASLPEVGVNLVPDRWAAVHRERITATYLFVRRLAALAGLVAVPVVVYYVGLAFVGGHVTGTLGALLAAPWPVKIGSAILALAAIATALGSARVALAELADAIRRSFHQQSVRVAVFLSLGPVLAGLVTATLLSAFGVGLPSAAITGAVMAVIVRLVYRLWQYVAFQAHTRERSPGASSVTVAGPTQVSLPDGDIWVARINATTVAWPTLPHLVDRVLLDVERRFDGADDGPTDVERYFEWIEDAGSIDLERFVSGQSAAARSRAVELVKSTSGRIETVEERLQREFGRETADHALQREREMGRLSVDDRFYRVHEPSLD